MVIDGRKIAKEILDDLKKKPKPAKFLAAVLVGEKSDSESFLKQKEKIARELGVDFRLYRFPFDIKQDALRKEVSKIADHKTCGAVIVQLPLPEHLNKYYVLNTIPREKDVDVLSERALGAFFAGRNPVLPPAVGTLEKILENLKVSLIGSRVVVIGRGMLVGQPVSIWLMNKVSELSVYASRTENLGSKLRNADIIVSGVGKQFLFGAADLKPDAVVVDFGYDFHGGKIFGDFNPPAAESAVAYTPTPGGTGPVLVAKLFENFYRLNLK
jgi:5,10-methylene-tetrahydrofolate dehydrogenase/methenyl tetrahydrofolate cyclohydrolase